MSVVHPAPSAGWYPDPEGRPEKRWWDGSTWTGSYAPIAQPTPAAAPQQPSGHVSTAPIHLTSLEQLATLPSGPGYASLLATLPSVPTFVEPEVQAPIMAAPAPQPHVSPAPGAFAPAPSAISQPPAAPAPQFSPAPYLALAASPAPDVASSTITPGPTPYAPPYPPVAQTHKFSAPASWAPPVPPQPAVAFAQLPATPTAYQPVPAESVPFVPSAPATPFAASRSGLELSYVAPSYTTPKFESSAPAFGNDGPEYEPFALLPSVRSGPAAPPEKVMTPSVWLLALLPALVGSLLFALVLFVPEFYSRFTQIGLLAILVVASIGLAVSDKRELAAAGYLRPASEGWLLFTPAAYLLARAASTRRVSASGIIPFLVLAASMAGLAAFALSLPEWVLPLLIATAD